MSRYRWIPARKAIEQMGFFPKLNGKTNSEMHQLLYDAVATGSIRVTVDGEVVPADEVKILLKWLDRMAPNISEDQLPYLPSAFGISLDDLAKYFDEIWSDSKSAGRPKKQRNPDDLLISEMHKMICLGNADSATGAARALYDSGRIHGAGTAENIIKRLERKFRKHYSS